MHLVKALNKKWIVGGILPVGLGLVLAMAAKFPSTREWLKAVGPLSAALVALIIAIWGDSLRHHFWHPSIEFDFDPAQDITKTVQWVKLYESRAIQSECFYIHLRIRNSGNEVATQVEVFIEELAQQQSDGTFHKVSDLYLPLNLRWAYIHEVEGLGPGMYYPQITPKAEKAVDLGHIIAPGNRPWYRGESPDGSDPSKTVLSLDLIWRSSRMDYLRLPGTYRCTVVAAAANAQPVRRELEVNLSGNWFSNDEEMRQKGIAVEFI